MELFTDHHFLIGDQHLRMGKPCQDFALSGVHEDTAFAIVSDGCSSGHHTDIGSRITTLSTIMAIKNGAKSSEEINSHQQLIMASAKQTLGLSSDDLLATCSYAYVSQTIGFCHVRGDGVVAWKNVDGSIGLIRLDWKNNMPFYPIYEEDFSESFIKAHGGDKLAKALSDERWTYTPSEKLQFGQNEFSIEEGIKGITYNFTSDDLKQIEYLAVFSDGVTQVEGIDWKDVICDLLSFKSTAGEFAKRRMIRFSKDIGKENHKALDDISFAVIQINHEEEKT